MHIPPYPLPRGATARLAWALLAATLIAAPALAQPTIPPGPRPWKPIPPPAGAIDIRAHGAACDGIKDDAPAITAALKAAAGKPGATVLFPPSAKPCLLKTALSLPEGVTLLAEPGTVTLKAAPGNAARPVLLSLASHSKLIGLSFDGGGADNANTNPVIIGYHATDITLDHIALRHTRGIGLLFSSSIARVAVHDSTFEDLGNHWKQTHLAKDRIQGVVFCCGDGNTDNSAEHNHFADIGLDALQFSNQTGAIARFNRFTLENGERAAVPAPDYPAAMYLVLDTRLTIADNRVEGAQGNCIDAPGIADAEILRNTVTGCGQAGIGLFDSPADGHPRVSSHNVLIEGNEITNNVHWAASVFKGGISLSGAASNVRLKANRITDTQARKTQQFAVFGRPGNTVSALAVEPSNKLDGNAAGVYSGLPAPKPN